MDTKPCPFCGESILVAAIKCKHCGEFLSQKPRPPEPKKPDAWQAVQAVLTLAAVGGFVWFMMKPTDCTGQKAQVQAEAMASAQDARRVTPQSLAEAYTANEVAAARDYKGKSIIIAGIVERIERDAFQDTPKVVLEGGGLLGVSLGFSKTHEAALSRLSKGSQIEALCIVDEYIMGPNLKGCRLY